MALCGVALGDSQLKFFCAQRLRLAQNVSFCTFSYGGATTASLRLLVDRLELRELDFCVLYVGGNDIANGASAEEIYMRLRDLVTRLRTLAQRVFVFKVVPKSGPLAQEYVRLRLNRMISRRLPLDEEAAVILNVDHLFFNCHGRIKLEMLAVDAYHIHRDRGIKALAFVLQKGLEKLYGVGVTTSHRGPARRFRWSCCSKCGAKGHCNDECAPFRSGPRLPPALLPRPV